MEQPYSPNRMWSVGQTVVSEGKVWKIVTKCGDDVFDVMDSAGRRKRVRVRVRPEVKP